MLTARLAALCCCCVLLCSQTGQTARTPELNSQNFMSSVVFAYKEMPSQNHRTCMGSFISKTTFVTSAFCVTNSTVGHTYLDLCAIQILHEPKLQAVKHWIADQIKESRPPSYFANYFLPAGYSPSTGHNDIALVQATPQMKVSRLTKGMPIQLPSETAVAATAVIAHQQLFAMRPGSKNCYAIEPVTRQRKVEKIIRLEIEHCNVEASQPMLFVNKICAMAIHADKYSFIAGRGLICRTPSGNFLAGVQTPAAAAAKPTKTPTDPLTQRWIFTKVEPFIEWIKAEHKVDARNQFPVEVTMEPIMDNPSVAKTSI